jgi:hypothetical protein
MKHKEDIGIGDPVQVRFAARPEPVVLTVTSPEPSDTRPSDVWRPATVCSLSRDKIGVAFAGGIRMEIARHSNTWRPA